MPEISKCAGDVFGHHGTEARGRTSPTSKQSSCGRWDQSVYATDLLRRVTYINAAAGAMDGKRKRSWGSRFSMWQSHQATNREAERLMAHPQRWNLAWQEFPCADRMGIVFGQKLSEPQHAAPAVK